MNNLRFVKELCVDALKGCSHRSNRDFCIANNIPKSSMSRWIGLEKSGSWGSFGGDSKKRRSGEFPEVEERLKEYVDFRNERMPTDHVGLSMETLQYKALDIYEDEHKEDKDFSSQKFNASNGWIHRFLRRNRYGSKTLHGEGGDLTPAVVECESNRFRDDLRVVLDRDSISVDRVYNADQTGLYYRKLPCRTYCHVSRRSSIRGVKLMKDKERITLMVCTSATGQKLPLAVIGKSASPTCFRQCGNKPPLPYFQQENAWFDKRVFLWWLKEVFSKAVRQTHGDQKVVLLLDNFSGHQLEASLIPRNVIVLFFPPNMTSHIQPADMGMISTLKTGYINQVSGIQCETSVCGGHDC